MAATLAQLLAPQTVVQIFQTLLGVYQANGFPVQSWQTGGTERTRLMAMATALSDISGNWIPTITAGGFLDYATGAWLQLLALEQFEVTYNAASFTQGTITLTAASGVSTSTYAAGQLIAVFGASGLRYLNTASVTVPNGPGSVNATFQAEFAGSAYADPSSSGALTLSTPIPGVTLTNPAGTFSSVAHVGAGTGTLTLGGSPVGPHQVMVTITATGASGVASWSYSLDGAPNVAMGAVASSTNIGGVGVNITLVNGGSGTSFVLNDTYLFNTPGSWITQQGSNVETDTALATRCRNRWSSLSPIPVSNFYSLLVTSTPSVGSQVTQVVVLPDTVVNNKVNIIVAGPAGALPPATIATIQAYVAPRVPIATSPVVVSPSTLTITLAGTVTVSASQQAAAAVAIQTAMSAYIGSVGINGTIRLAAIIELIMAVSGVVDVSGVTINAVATNLTLGTSSTFVVPSLAALGFSYVSQ